MLEYRSLDPLRVRIDTHLRYSEHPDDVDAAVIAAVVNIAGAYPRLLRLVGDAVEAHGFDPTVYTVAVDGDNLPDLVAEVFAATRVERHDNALVFDAPGPVTAYAVSMLTGFGVADDDPARPSVVEHIAAAAGRWFAAAGTVRDPKGYVVVIGW